MKARNFLAFIALAIAGKFDFGTSTGGMSWFKLTSANGTERFFFINNSGTLKVNATEPTADGDGSAV